MIFVLDTAIGLGIWIPFIIGKTTALLSVRLTIRLFYPQPLMSIPSSILIGCYKSSIYLYALCGSWQILLSISFNGSSSTSASLGFFDCLAWLSVPSSSLGLYQRGGYWAMRQPLKFRISQWNWFVFSSSVMSFVVNWWTSPVQPIHRSGQFTTFPDHCMDVNFKRNTSGHYPRIERDLPVQPSRLLGLHWAIFWSPRAGSQSVYHKASGHLDRPSSRKRAYQSPLCSFLGLSRHRFLALFVSQCIDRRKCKVSWTPCA